MAKSDVDEFSAWLQKELRELQADEEAFGDYILSILQGDEDEEEKSDALADILSGFMEGDLTTMKNEIFSKWQACNKSAETKASATTAMPANVENKLVELLHAQTLQTVAQRQMTPEERKIKEQILAQYAKTEVSDDEEEDEDATAAGSSAATTAAAGKATTGGTGAKSKNALMGPNTNLQDVMQAQKEKREQAKAESAAKKQKDKEDLKKQKQMREEKKEKRKTVKGERRR